MAELFQNREHYFQHVGKCIAAHRMRFYVSQEFWNTPSQVCSIAECGWAYSLVYVVNVVDAGYGPENMYLH